MENLERICIKVIQFIRYEWGCFKIRMSKKNMSELMQIVVGGNNRIPVDILRPLSTSINANNAFPAGKIIEFETRRDELCFKVVYKKRCVLKHMSITGTSGIDVYLIEGESYSWIKCIAPNSNTQMYVKETIKLGNGLKKICCFMPSYASVNNFLVDDDIVFTSKKDKKTKIAFYGSSITHGCAASRPALSYSNLIAKRLNCEILNFGFSESAKGEHDVIEYISNLGVKVMVIEYDHNASVMELKDSHLNVYKTIRNNSNCWIIFMSRFSGGISISVDEETERVEIIKKTYEYAVKAGDRKVRFIDGRKLFNNDKSGYFVDGVHPNDLGMYYISEKIYSVILEGEMLNED